MGYVNVGVGKLKTTAKLTVAYEHNERFAFCSNADRARAGENMNLMPRQETYAEYFEKRIAQSPIYTGEHPRNIRRDAVKALDICVKVGRNEEKDNPRFNVNRFCHLTKDWAVKRFGEENIAGMIFHGDEQCPHIHIIVIPMTKDGRLCANDMINGPKELSELQTEVANQLATLGVKRGLRHSVAQHSTIKAFYGAVDAARIDSLPTPEAGESADHYAVRANAAFNDFKSQQLHEMLALKRQVVEARTLLYNAKLQLQKGGDLCEK